MRPKFTRLDLHLVAAFLSTAVILFVCYETTRAQASRKIDQFGDVNDEDAMARLDRFAVELKSHPETRGIIVANNRLNHSFPRGTFLRWAHGYRNYLINMRGVEAGRIGVTEGDRKLNINFELWVLPANQLSTISEEANEAEPSLPELFDDLSVGPEKLCGSFSEMQLYKLPDAMRILSDVLTHHSRAKVWIVVRPRSGNSRVATRALINQSRQLLIDNGVRAERVLTAERPPRSSTCSEVKTWIVPSDSSAPDEAGDLARILKRAESEEYTVRRVEFTGNAHIRDNVLRKQFVQKEGDIFSRELLDKSLTNLSRLRVAYPVSLGDVEARLDQSERLIDLTIFFRERRRKK